MYVSDDRFIWTALGIAVLWFGSGAYVIHLLEKEMKKWVMGPDYCQILGFLTLFCFPLGLWELRDVKKRNRNGTAPMAIVNPWHDNS